jgi:hypothetical protein
LDTNERYQLVPPDANRIYRSAELPGLWLREAWLWQDPLPEAEDALLEIDGEAYVRHKLERFRRRGLLPSDEQS